MKKVFSTYKYLEEGKILNTLIGPLGLFFLNLYNTASGHDIK